MKVAVFYGSTIPVKDRETVLKKAIDESTLTVFGRSEDFSQALDGNIPIIMASTAIEQVRTDYEPVLQFKFGGKAEFHYRFLSADKLDISKMEVLTFGVVMELERRQMKTFFSNKVGVKITKINTVSKPEDLFPLLAFKSADVIAVSEENIQELKKMYSADTQELKMESNFISYPRLYLKKGENNAAIVGRFAAMSVDQLKALGFDGVERIAK